MGQQSSMETRNIVARLPPPAECFAILIGCAELTIFGIRGFTSPKEWLKGYGLPVLHSPNLRRDPKDTQRKQDDDHSKIHDTQYALVCAIAARNVQNGLVILTYSCILQDRRALGVAVLAGLVTTIADTLVVRWYGTRGALLGHLIGILNCAAIGGALLLWRRDVALW